MSDVVLRMQGVSVVRDGNVLLHDLDWTVRSSERWVILGPNGAGKTTLLQAATAMPVDSGEVEALGERLAEADLDLLLPRIGLSSAVLADYLPRRERVLDVVMTAAYAVMRRGREEYDETDERRALDLLAQLGCRALATRQIGTLSEGERKRVHLARALMTDPELLLLDEPAAGLDLGGREALLRSLGRLAHDPKAPALVLVTHHVEEIPLGFTHALLLRRGGVVAAGPIEQTLTAATLSACFGFPLFLDRLAGRWTARAA